MNAHDRAPSWHRAASATELRAAAKAGKGVYAPGDLLAGVPPLALFYSALDHRVFAVQDSCPHAGHQLSAGDILVGDVEDFAPGCGLGVVVACPAHAFTYDTASGHCLSNPGRSGGQASRWEARIEGDDILIGGRLPEQSAPPEISKVQYDRIQLSIVEQALERKYP